MCLIPSIISECAPNSNFSANHRDNENDQRIIELFNIFTTTMRILAIFSFCQCAIFIVALTHKWSTCMKIKGSKIIHVKFRGGWKLIILKCFVILYVQIESAKLRAYSPYPSLIHALRALPIINTRLRVYASVRFYSPISPLRAFFVLCCCFNCKVRLKT